MKFVYTGFDRAGKEVRDTVEANDLPSANDALRRRGVYVSEIGPAEASTPKQTSGNAKGMSRLTGSFGRGKRLHALSTFLRQLSVLVSTGTPLVDALQSLEKQSSDPAFRAVLSAMRGKLEEGLPFHEAMAAHPQYFDAVARSLVAAGESGGKLDAMLDRLSKLTRQQQKIRSQVSGAMVYPCVLICIAVVVLSAMLFFVMPRFEGLFATLGSPLPPSTKVLMDIAAFARANWPYIAGAGFVIMVGMKLFFSTAAGRRAWDVGTVRMPQVGKVTRSFATARIARVLGVLIEGKVALVDALRLTRDATGNQLFSKVIEDAEDAVTRGESLSSTLARTGLIDASVCEAIRSGERTGQVAPVLLSVADYLDEDNEVLVKSLTSVIEPLILVCMGIMVGAVAISMFLPLFDLTAAGGGAG